MHTSSFEPGLCTYNIESIDVFGNNSEFRSISLSLAIAAVPTEACLDAHLRSAMRRSFINVRGPAAIVKGAEELSARHYIFPAPQLLKSLLAEGFDETASVCGTYFN